jgi:hypothetical protein
MASKTNADAGTTRRGGTGARPGSASSQLAPLHSESFWSFRTSDIDIDYEDSSAGLELEWSLWTDGRKERC